MKYCSNCGKENNDDARFCLNCGAKFGEDNSTTPVVNVDGINENNYYTQQPYVKTTVESKSNLGKVSMILGIIAVVLSVVCCCCYPLGYILGPAALITGIVSLVKRPYSQKGMAIAGVVLGAFALMFALVITLMSPEIIEGIKEAAYQICAEDPYSEECQTFKDNFPEWFQ